MSRRNRSRTQPHMVLHFTRRRQEHRPHLHRCLACSHLVLASVAPVPGLPPLIYWPHTLPLLSVQSTFPPEAATVRNTRLKLHYNVILSHKRKQCSPVWQRWHPAWAGLANPRLKGNKSYLIDSENLYNKKSHNAQKKICWNKGRNSCTLWWLAGPANNPFKP